MREVFSLKKLGKAAAYSAAVVLFIIYTLLVCYAESNTYYIPEAEMTIELPDNIVVATQGIRENDDLFNKDKGGWDYIQTMSEMRENGDYLLGRSSDKSCKLEVKVSDNSEGIKNLNKLSEKKLNAFCDTIRSESDVFEVTEKEINSIKYAGVVRNTKLSDVVLYSYEYTTVLNSKLITVKITSYNDRLNNAETELLKTVVTSITFSNTDVERTIPKIGGTLIFSFCMIAAGFVVLVIYKLNEEKAKVIIAKIISAKEKHENKQKIKQADTEEKSSDKTDEKTDTTSEEAKTDTNSAESENAVNSETEKTIAKTEEPQNTKTSTQQEHSDANNDKADEPEEEIYDIDLDEAIANFDDSAEARQRRRDERNKTVKKKKGLFK